jgi:hypothetical protein
MAVGVKTAQSFSVPVPEKFKFQGPSGLVFESAKEVIFAPSEQGAGQTKTIPAYQGETFTDTFASEGSANQVFTLKKVESGKYAASGSVVVKVDGAVWDESDFITFDQTDQYEVAYFDDPPTARFGDGVAGNIPKKGASVEISYVATAGKTGKVSNATIVKEVNPLVVSGKSIQLTVTNPQGSSGGDDAEELASVQSFAGKVFKSRQVAVTRDDYEALAGSFADPLFGRVAVAQALSSRSASEDLELLTLLNTIRYAFRVPVATIRTAISDATSGTSCTLQQILDKLSSRH